MHKDNPKQLLPKLRFPEFKRESAWIFEQIAKYLDEYREKSTEQDQHEVLTSARDGLLPQKDHYGEGRITDRKNIGFNVIPPKYITYRSRSDNRRFFFNENNLGITGVISVYYPVFRIKNGSNKFFIELCTRFADEIGCRSVGNAQTVLSFNELKKIQLPFTKLEEQQKIADCFSSTDEVINLEEQKLDALQNHKKGLMQNLFPAEGETLPKFRFPEFQNDPKWTYRPLSDVLSYEQPTNYIVKKTNYTLTGIPVLTANKSFVLGYTEETFGIYNKGYAIIFDDFTTDKKYVDFDFKIKSSAIKILTLKKKDNLKVVFEIMNNIDFNSKDHKRYYISQYQNIEIALPENKEQQKIADCFSSIDETITAQVQKVEALKEHKIGLLQRLFPNPEEVQG